jgi:glycosyltransferase involved in cell wall biosynthesis
MTILLVTSWPFPHLGGVSSHIQLLARQLGIAESDVISWRHYHAPPATLAGRVAGAIRREGRRVLRRDQFTPAAKDLGRIIAVTDAEIVHCHDAMATWAALFARRRAAKPFRIVSTVHGPMSRHMVEEGFPADGYEVRAVEQCEREAWAGCDAIIAVDTTQARIVESQGAAKDKIFVIPNAVDLRQIDAAIRRLPLARQAARPWVIVPRRLAPKNGVEFAVRALALMPDRPQLLLAGSGPEQERLTDLVRELNLEADVTFLGALNHAVLLPLVATADVVLIPSVPVHGIEEATSIAAIEAMASGRTVLASNIGGLKELICDGINGLLIEPGNPAELAATLTALLGDPKLRQTLGAAARQSVAERFCVEIWINRHRGVYRAIGGLREFE